MEENIKILLCEDDENLVCSIRGSPLTARRMS